MIHDATLESAIDLIMVQIPEGRMEYDRRIEAFLPPSFMADPMRYFDEQGKAIRTGEVTYKKTGRIKRDPGSVRDFPIWRARSPFYEFYMMQLVLAEHVPGFRWVRNGEGAMPQTEFDRLRAETEAVIADLAADFADVGIRTPWHYKDMALVLENGASRVQEVIPVDWERVELDFDRLNRVPEIGPLIEKLQPKVGCEKRWIGEEWKLKRLAKA